MAWLDLNCLERWQKSKLLVSKKGPTAHLAHSSSVDLSTSELADKGLLCSHWSLRTQGWKPGDCDGTFQMLLEGKSFSCSIARLGKMGFGFASSWALQARDSKCAGGQSAKLSHSSGFCLRHLANEKSLASPTAQRYSCPYWWQGIQH